MIGIEGKEVPWVRSVFKLVPNVFVLGDGNPVQHLDTAGETLALNFHLFSRELLPISAGGPW